MGLYRLQLKKSMAEGWNLDCGMHYNVRIDVVFQRVSRLGLAENNSQGSEVHLAR